MLQFIVQKPGQWKQLKCQPRDEQTRKLWHIYTTGYFAAVRKDKIMQIATSWLEQKDSMQSEVNQKERDRNTMMSLIYGS